MAKQESVPFSKLLFQQTWSWIHAPLFDVCFILMPPFVISLLILISEGVRDFLINGPIWVWIGLALLLDYGHQYAALYRTYLDPSEIQERRQLLTLVPFFAFLAGLFLYTFGRLIFWRCIIYFGIFHFIRQQYGFMRLYSRKQVETPLEFWVDRMTIYATTLYPLLYEHTHLPRAYSWFETDDVLVPLHFGPFYKLLFPIYVAILVIYVLKELVLLVKDAQLNLPKNLLMLGTAIAWYVGMVRFNAFMIFYVVLQICHSMPYIALIWAYGHRKWSRTSQGASKSKFNYGFFFRPSSIAVFLGLIVILSYVELSFLETLDLQSQYPPEIFGSLEFLRPKLMPFLAVLMPIMAVPQLTHYVLDAVIWRMRSGHRGWLSIL
jgi:hypothetical protein